MSYLASIDKKHLKIQSSSRYDGLALLNVPIEMQLIAKGAIIVLALAIANRGR